VEIIIEAAKSALIENLKGQKLAVIRIRGGRPYVYPNEVFLKPVLYGGRQLGVCLNPFVFLGKDVYLHPAYLSLFTKKDGR